ncbi:hypothetical protein ADILRU_1709 [Leifsonia rubra CMS 76R]|nr:hypothetical protein ADILRU_1709 [Leifsonia rubra CMS 76R]
MRHNCPLMQPIVTIVGGQRASLMPSSNRQPGRIGWVRLI